MTSELDNAGREMPEQVTGSNTSPSEKLLTPEEVGKLVAAKKHEAREAKEAQANSEKQLMEAKAEIDRLKSQSMGGMKTPVDEDAIMNRVHEKMMSTFDAEKKRESDERLQEELHQVARQFHNKMSTGKEQFDDFDEVVQDFDPSEFPAIAFMANQADNTAAIIYDLVQNKSKLAALTVLAKESPRLAEKEILKLSQSIKANDEALANERTARNPLDRMKSSRAGSDNGQRSVKDFKSMPWLRG